MSKKVFQNGARKASASKVRKTETGAEQQKNSDEEKNEGDNGWHRIDKISI